jgi:hypothetical protein
MKYFILSYDVVDDYLERRQEFRAEHLALATLETNRGLLRYAGAYADPADGAAMVFRCEDESVVRAFVDADPYVANGLVTKWHIREWTVVAGADYAAG